MFRCDPDNKTCSRDDTCPPQEPNCFGSRHQCSDTCSGVRYTCYNDGENSECQEDKTGNGEYSTESACIDDCSSDPPTPDPVQKFYCDVDSYKCQPCTVAVCDGDISPDQFPNSTACRPHCTAPTRATCVRGDFDTLCELSASGEFDSMASCEAGDNCSAAPTLYACNPHDENGEMIQTCEVADCDPEDANCYEIGDKCEASCGSAPQPNKDWKWKCPDWNDGIGAACTQDPNGTYATQKECSDSCDDSAYRCNPHNKTCSIDDNCRTNSSLSHCFHSSSQCSATCSGIRYTCYNDGEESECREDKTGNGDYSTESACMDDCSSEPPTPNPPAPPLKFYCDHKNVQCRRCSNAKCTNAGLFPVLFSNKSACQPNCAAYKKATCVRGDFETYCERSADGEFDSLADCEAGDNCAAAPTLYACDNSTGNCAVKADCDPEDANCYEFGDKCEASCGSAPQPNKDWKWKCPDSTDGIGGDCVQAADGTFATQKDCREGCGLAPPPPGPVTYECSKDERGWGTCMITRNGGEYPTRGQCQAVCNSSSPSPLNHWHCNDPQTGTCKKSEDGKYSSEFQCEVNCDSPSPPVPPPNTDSCDLTTCTCDGVSLLALKDEVYETAPDAGGYSYQVAVCGEIPKHFRPPVCNQDGLDKTLEAPAVLRYKPGAEGVCNEVGSVGPCAEGEECGMEGVKTLAGINITWRYQQEPGDATEHFTIVMSKGKATEPGPATVGGDGGNDYTAYWAGLDYSNRPPPPPPPDTSNVGEEVAISLGVLVLIIGGGLTFAMCGGYCVFRKRQRKAGSLEEIWSNLDNDGVDAGPPRESARLSF